MKGGLKKALVGGAVALTLALGAADISVAKKYYKHGYKKSGSSAIVKASDLIIARPVLFATTIVGAVGYVVTLPVTYPTKTYKDTEDNWVKRPAKATFQRCLGCPFSW